MEVKVPFYNPLMRKAHLGVKHFLSVYKRLKTKVSKGVINEYKRLVEDSNIKSQGFMKFDKVAPIGELRIYTCSTA